MKKLIIVVLAITMIMSLACCGENTATVSVSSSTDTALINSQQTGMPNPWTESSAAEIKENLGVGFYEPDGASDISYQWMESDNLAQMHFTVDGVDWTARIKPSVHYDDISGMEYTWDAETDADELTVDDFEVKGTCRTTKDEGKNVISGIWQNDRGFMYSLSAVADNELDLSLAQTVFGGEALQPITSGTIDLVAASVELTDGWYTKGMEDNTEVELVRDDVTDFLASFTVSCQKIYSDGEGAEYWINALNGNYGGDKEIDKITYNGIEYYRLHAADDQIILTADINDEYFLKVSCMFFDYELAERQLEKISINQ